MPLVMSHPECSKQAFDLFLLLLPSFLAASGSWVLKRVGVDRLPCGPTDPHQHVSVASAEGARVQARAVL